MQPIREILQQVAHSVKFLINGAALGAAIATLLGFLGSWWWRFELLDHLRSHYCLILLAAIIAGSLSRQATTFLWCFPLAINLALILPLFFSFPPLSYSEQAFPPENRLRLLHFNLNRDNDNKSRVIQYIDSQAVDIIFLQEINAEWLERLQAEFSRYRVSIAVPDEGSLGMAMLLPVQPSKSIQIEEKKIIHLPPSSPRPLLETTILWNQKKVAILSFSATRVRNKETSNFQKNEFISAAGWSKKQQDNRQDIIIIGDFNSTPWSVRLRNFSREGNLINSQSGFGFQTTWPTLLFAPLQIAIDHCFHSQGIQTLARSPGEDVGSDHLPLFVELGYK